MLLEDLDGQSINELLHYANFFWAFLAVTFIILLISFLYAKYVAKLPSIKAAFFSGNACSSNSCMLALPILSMTMGRVGTIYGVLAVLVLVIIADLRSGHAAASAVSGADAVEDEGGH